MYSVYLSANWLIGCWSKATQVQNTQPEQHWGIEPLTLPLVHGHLYLVIVLTFNIMVMFTTRHSQKSNFETEPKVVIKKWFEESRTVCLHSFWHIKPFNKARIICGRRSELPASSVTGYHCHKFWCFEPWTKVKHPQRYFFIS